MTRKEAVAILERWSAQPAIRRLMPQIVTALRLLLGKPAVAVGASKVAFKGWREPD